MTLNQLFPLAVAALCAGASAVYTYQHHWSLAVVWGAYTVADVALAMV